MGQSLGIIGPIILIPNRDYGYPIVGALYIPIVDRAKCDKNEEFLFAIRGREEGRPEWWWVVRDFLKILRKSRNNRWELSAPPLIATNDITLWGL